MGLNDESEKLRQAKAWLNDPDAPAEHQAAARDHVMHIIQNSYDMDLRREAMAVATGIGLVGGW
jgi:hypothetical protein